MTDHSNTALSVQPSSTPESKPLHASEPTIPDYLLCDILANLDATTLLTCRSVCRFWKWNTENRIHLRQLLFTQPPLPDPPETHNPAITLHPVLRKLDYYLHALMYFRDPTSPIKPLEDRLYFRMNNIYPATSSVATNFATTPAVQEIVLRLCGATRSVRSEGGVTVWDLMVCFDNFIKDRHCQGSDVPSRYHLAWDHRRYPFAGFRVVAVRGERVVVRPEFHNLPAVTRQLSGCELRGEELLITFNGGERDNGEGDG